MRAVMTAPRRPERPPRAPLGGAGKGTPVRREARSGPRPKGSHASQQTIIATVAKTSTRLRKADVTVQNRTQKLPPGRGFAALGARFRHGATLRVKRSKKGTGHPYLDNPCARGPLRERRRRRQQPPGPRVSSRQEGNDSGAERRRERGRKGSQKPNVSVGQRKRWANMTAGAGAQREGVGGGSTHDLDYQRLAGAAQGRQRR
jgi:hypothetical protein